MAQVRASWRRRAVTAAAMAATIGAGAGVTPGCARIDREAAWVSEGAAKANAAYSGYPRLADFPATPTDVRSVSEFDAATAELRAVGRALDDIRPEPDEFLPEDAAAYIEEVRRRALAAAAAAPEVTPLPDVPPAPQE